MTLMFLMFSAVFGFLGWCSVGAFGITVGRNENYPKFYPVLGILFLILSCVAAYFAGAAQ